jgi:hypothetical protein
VTVPADLEPGEHKLWAVAYLDDVPPGSHVDVAVSVNVHVKAKPTPGEDAVDWLLGNTGVPVAPLFLLILLGLAAAGTVGLARRRSR